MNKDTNVILYIYNSFKDPLFQNLLLTYTKTLTQTHPRLNFHLITFEQENYRISSNEKIKVQQELNNLNIFWYPQKFHTGRFILLKKAYDIISVSGLIVRLRLTKNIKVIWAFANVAAAQAIIFSKLLNMKLMVYSYEPHSDFLVELGKWSKNSLKYKILNSLEWYAGKHGGIILTGTLHMVNKLESLGSKAKVYRAPTSVDENDYFFRSEARQIICQKHNIPYNKNIILYIGKFGDLYYYNEIPIFLSEIKNHIDCHFLIVTSNRFEEILNLFKENNIQEKDLTITGNISYEEIKQYISSADLGISAVPPTPSQKFRSPTKVAEYLLCGLPYITCKGVSEDDIYADQFNVGIVVNHFSQKEAIAAISKIKLLFSEDKEVVRKRCREVGLEYRSKKNIDRLLDNIFEYQI